MRGLLSPMHYTDPAVFAVEARKLFGQLWIFVGLAQLVAEPDQFLTRHIGGREIVVQNFEGELRAFENVCAHRGKLVQTEPFGRRPLVCGYHGWRYSQTGVVATIPFESDCYGFEAKERDALALTRFALERVGNLLFVNVSDDPMPLASQFAGEILESLESVSNAFDDEVLVAKFTGRYNWKLAYENLRDGLHPRFVHTTSLNQDVRFSADIPEHLAQYDADPDGIELGQLSFGGAEGTFLKQQRLPFHDSVIRWGEHDAYFNWLLYPNTHVVCSDGGYSFSIEHHEPLGPDRTEVTIYFLTARKRKRYSGSAAVLWEYAKAAKLILDEDTAVMEQAHAGLAGARRSVTQGRYELQNRVTDRWYLRQLARTAESFERERQHA